MTQCVTCGGPLDTSGLSRPKAACVCTACVRAGLEPVARFDGWLNFALWAVFIVLVACAFVALGLVLGGYLAQ